MPLGTESWCPDSCAQVKVIPSPQTVLQHTFSWFHFFITKNLIPALDSFIVVSGTVECTFGEQIVFRLKTQNWTIQNWGPCSCAQAMTLPAPLPTKKMYRRNLLKWLDTLFKQFLHSANEELQMQVSARELKRNWMHHSFSNCAVDT